MNTQRLQKNLTQIFSHDISKMQGMPVSFWLFQQNTLLIHLPQFRITGDKETNHVRIQQKSWKNTSFLEVTKEKKTGKTWLKRIQRLKTSYEKKLEAT